MTRKYVARLKAFRDICSDVRLFEFTAAEFPSSTAPLGSHIDVWCGSEARDHVRSYSLIGSGLPPDSFLIAVRKVPDSRGGSAFMWNLSVGDTLLVSGPLDEFSLSERPVPKVLVAGGIGITPLVGMAERLAADEAEFRLVFAGRSRESMPFLANLESRLGTRISVFDASAGETLDMSAMVQGLPRNAEMYVCGPIGMLNAARSAWEANGRAMSDLRFETFANSGNLPNTAFRVSVPRLQLEVEVGSDQTLLDALEAAGADPLFNCRRGECGLCAVEILDVDGEIDHRDVFFSDHEKAACGKLCACVSRVSGRHVTIELP